MKYLIAFSLLLFGLPSQATEMVGALSAGQGGTGRAAVEGSESLYLNPASLALMNKFYSAISYQSGFTQKDVSRNTYSITFTDATDSAFLPGALGYRRHQISDRGIHYKENEFKAGAAFRLTDRVSAGFGGSYLSAESQLGDNHSQYNLDGGLLFGLLPNWGLSLSGENLLKQDEALPLALRRISRVAMGTQYVFQHMVTLRYEALMSLYTENTQLLGHRAGFGINMRGNFMFNAGYSVDDARAQNWGSVGLAWRGPRLKLAYSVQKEDRSELGTRHLIDLWMDI